MPTDGRIPSLPARLSLLLALATWSCGGGDSSGPGGPSPVKLAFQVEPAAYFSSAALSIKVAVEDADGAVVANSSIPVSLTLGANPTSSSLGGAVTVHALNGIAVFPDLSVSASGGGYTIVASSPGLPSVTSASFSVAAMPLAITIDVPQVTGMPPTFLSLQTNTSTPALDFLKVTGTATWIHLGGRFHSVQSLGSPAFTSQGFGDQYQFTFNSPGAYQYDCRFHKALMTGRIVVVP